MQQTVTGSGFQDLVNHELRTPLTAAGTALQTLARQLASAGGPSLELVDIALRNIRRLERTVDWACDYLSEGVTAAASPEPPAPVALLGMVEDLDELAAGQPVTWSTGAGDWEAAVHIDREAWRRLLRQMLRAVACLAPRQAAHLELSLVVPPAGDLPDSLLVVVNLDHPSAEVAGRDPRAVDAAEQLRRLLAFTVNPALARRLALRYDVMQLADRLRLRLLLPLDAVETCCEQA
jgi:signal transduction histidine kinase